ncbi:MAG: NAD(P)/FAD-dependent oxidoreductase [Phenylobacterium sp.]|nr:NAD(P)/FAD-dependent oxidoreductase [Methylobacterium sp.]MCA3739191.1 NAD(P)/FAD-dependent oxidoreductase [Phenylobacterium sp.]MCA3753352.1 NAD(P)/FAD-dependent oxidoreductase [Phenylobacterium sp.]MCA6246864.1 NAD(P)/FAD-dependent oxidoreductase [Phenylobacterium sp.]
MRLPLSTYDHNSCQVQRSGVFGADEETGMSEHFDVLIVGAGISGIGSAHHLSQQHPEKSFAILEAHESFGGTWLIHTYPGIRSDSDLFTFGYRFKPWAGPPIASGQEILTYLREVIDESGLGEKIRYGRRVKSASWSSTKKIWTVEVANAATGAVETMTTNFLWMCSGYYRHDAGYRPDWPGLETYQGRVVHPQSWPADLDLSDKRVIVIGSGATAATIVPSIAGRCAHVTMLQRSPTYFYIDSNRNELADTLRSLEVDPAWIHEIVRRKILHDQKLLTDLALGFPEEVKAHLIDGVRAQVGPEFDVATHFTPRYAPWQQRIAFVPDGDLFKAVKSGKVDIVTDQIDRFTGRGVVLKSGRQLEADVIITATGFNLAPLGDVALDVDGEPVTPDRHVTWRGMMLSDVPNMVWVFGYFRASWTLRVDLLGDFVCRLLTYMDERGVRSVVPRLPEGAQMTLQSWSEGSQFAPGYLQRGAPLLPKRGEGPEWTHTQDYWTEQDELPRLDFAQAPLRFA